MTTLAGLYTNGYFYENPTGVASPASSAEVRVKGTTTRITLYTDKTKATTASNPLTTGASVGTPGIDAKGTVIVYADPGDYDLYVNGAYTYPITVLPDPAEIGTTTGTFDGGPVSFDVTFAAGTGPVVYDTTDGATARRLIVTNGVVGVDGGADQVFEALLHVGTVAVNDVSVPVSYPYATTVTKITVQSDALLSGSTVWKIFVKGPGNSYAETDTGKTVTISGGQRIGTATVSIALQQYDRIWLKVSSIGATPASLVSGYFYDNPLIAAAARPAAPTIGTASVAGQPNGTAAVTWTAVAVPSGQTRTQYTVTSSHGEQLSGISPSATSAVLTGLNASSQTFTVTQTTDLGGTSLPSADSNNVTVTSGSQRLSPAQQQGQNYTTVINSSYSYDSAVTPTGSASGLVGSAKIIATAAGAAEIQLTNTVPVTPSETGIPLSAIFKNDSGVSLTFGIWVKYYTGITYSGTDSAAYQLAVAAGATTTFTTTANAPAGVDGAKVSLQMIATTSAQQCHVGSVSYG